jgi:hypothetical protein
MLIWGQPPSAVRTSKASPLLGGEFQVGTSSFSFTLSKNLQATTDAAPESKLRSFAPPDSRGRLSPHGLCRGLRSLFSPCHPVSNDAGPFPEFVGATSAWAHHFALADGFAFADQGSSFKISRGTVWLERLKAPLHGSSGRLSF